MKTYSKQIKLGYNHETGHNVFLDAETNEIFYPPFSFTITWSEPDTLYTQPLSQNPITGEVVPVLPMPGQPLQQGYPAPPEPRRVLPPPDPRAVNDYNGGCLGFLIAIFAIILLVVILLVVL